MMNVTNQDSGRNIGALALIAVGVLFLLGQGFGMDIWGMAGSIFNFSWPFFVIIPGVVFLFVALFFQPKLAIAGTVVTGTGLILFYQETTGRFETWAYLWALIPVFVGVGLIYMGWRENNAGTQAAGRRVAMIGLVMTAVFGVFMESIFTGSFDTILGYFVPMLLIGGGAWLLLAPKRRTAVTGEKSKGYIGDKPKRHVSGASVNPDLQRQIDEAIREDEPYA